MQQVFLAVYFAGIPALCTFALYKFARIWLWAAPIIATLLGTVMMTVYLGGLPVPTDERWLTFWEVLMPVQQLIAISICLGALADKSMDAGTQRTIVQKLGEEELLAMRRGYEKAAGQHYPLNTQLEYGETRSVPGDGDKAFLI